MREGAEMNETEMPALWNTVFYAEKGGISIILRGKRVRGTTLCV